MPSPVGTERLKQNGYIDVKTEDGWELKHRLIAEETLGRNLEEGEQVYFIDGDKTNYDPENIGVRTMKLKYSSRSRRNLMKELYIVRKLVEEATSRLEDVERRVRQTEKIEQE